METCINYCEPGWAYMSSDERRWINKLRTLAEKHPDECVIIKQPDENDGVIYGKFPQKWMRVAPPKQVVMSDERKAFLAQKLEQYRRTKAEEQDDE